jgi:hypothetical protein
VPSNVVHRSFEAETVLLNLSTGRYHGLNTTGGRMFELLSETGSFEAALEGLVAEYDQPADLLEKDLARLCVDLQERGLIEVDTAS